MCPTSSGKIHTRIYHQPCFRLGSHRDGFKRMKNWLRRLEKKNKKNPSPPLPPVAATIDGCSNISNIRYSEVQRTKNTPLDLFLRRTPPPDDSTLSEDHTITSRAETITSPPTPHHD
ncbi:unnamed protein product [Rhizophagus irregularis]|nr:unnamed protein product [Rhizophagus irregularis]